MSTITLAEYYSTLDTDDKITLSSMIEKLESRFAGLPLSTSNKLLLMKLSNSIIDVVSYGSYKVFNVIHSANGVEIILMENLP